VPHVRKVREVALRDSGGACPLCRANTPGGACTAACVESGGAAVCVLCRLVLIAATAVRARSRAGARRAQSGGGSRRLGRRARRAGHERARARGSAARGPERARRPRRGLVACANANAPHTNGSQFFFTFDRCDHLDRKNTIFGRITGESIYNAMSFGELDVRPPGACNSAYGPL